MSSATSAVLLLQKHPSDSQRLTGSMFCYEISNPYLQFIGGQSRLGTRLALKNLHELHKAVLTSGVSFLSLDFIHIAT